MSQNEINNMEHPEGIDELLNSYLDGELDARHQTEVERLLKHDKQIAERLKSLRNCKRIVSSLPYAEAPDGMLENIKASLKDKKSPVSSAAPVSLKTHQQRVGARYLFARRFITAAAMIGLVAVFAALIYSIIIPEVTITTTDIPVAVETKPQPGTVAVAQKPVQFSGRLELKTENLSEVAAFINKAIEFNVPSERQIAAGPDMLKESHTLSCSRKDFRLLMDDLSTIWDKINSATLFIDTGSHEGQIAIDAVTPEQLIEITKQDSLETQIKTARYFAAVNSITERSPGREVMVAIEESTPPLLTIPKPVLTSNNKPVTKAADEAEQNVLLTIVVTGSR